MLQDALEKYAEEPITRQLLLDALKEYKRPYDKISELLKKKQLISLKRGIYISGPSLKITPPEPFLLANHLSGPSYVSLESALSHYGMIPEKVYGVSSVTTNKSLAYTTPSGKFNYIHLPFPYYSFGICRVKLSERQTVLMATPEKAVCDKIITTPGIQLRSAKQVREFLIDDLRIDNASLKNLDRAAVQKWISNAPKKESLAMLVKTLQEI